MTENARTPGTGASAPTGMTTVKGAWPIRQLDELASPDQGAIKIGPFGSQLKKSELTDSGVHVVGIENVLARRFDGLGGRFVSADKYETLRSFEIRPGDVVVTMMGTVGEAAVVPEGTGVSIMDSHLLRFRPNSSLCEADFIAWYFRSAAARASLNGRAHGAIMKGLNSGIVRSLPVPLPALSEQRRIVEILDQAERLRHLRAEADTKAERILAALYRESFVDRASPWPVEALGGHLRENKGSLQSGPFGSDLHNSDFVQRGPVRVVGIDNVLDGRFDDGRNRRISASKYDELKRFTLEAGDVLVTIMGTVGRSCVFPQLPEPAICTKHVYRIQLTQSLEPEYVSASIRYSPSVRRQLGASVTGQIVAGITSEDLRRLRILIPPRDLQDRFASFARACRRQADAARQWTCRMDETFTGLQHRAFSGSLTVSWRKAHVRDLLEETRKQVRVQTE